MWCMKRSEVYSWRLESHLKGALEAAAREENRSVGSLLAEIVRAWLAERGAGASGQEAAQNRIREEAARYLGSVRGGDPSRAGEAAARVKRILEDKRR